MLVLEEFRGSKRLLVLAKVVPISKAIYKTTVEINPQNIGPDREDWNLTKSGRVRLDCGRVKSQRDVIMQILRHRRGTQTGEMTDGLHGVDIINY